MLTLIEGGLSSGIEQTLTDSIKRSTEGGRRVYLIVPEQQTVGKEYDMAEALPPDAPLHFEVTNFTRFTNTAFREIGGISGEYCSPSAKSLIMWRALTELSPMLTLTNGRKNVSDGTVRKALAAVGEMQSLGISPTALSDTVDADIRDRRLSQKLKDLSLLYSLYTKMLGERYNDSTQDADALGEALDNDPSFLSNTEIYVDGFTSFTEPQYKLLGVIMKHAPLSVTLKLDRSGEGFEYKELYGARRRLLTLADSARCDKKLIKVPPRDLERTPVLGEICELLWRSEGAIDNDSLQFLAKNDGALRIFEAETVYDECDFLAADIKRRIISGDRFSDIAVIARDAGGYVGIIDSIFESANIPCFISKNTDTSDIPLFKMISTAYKILTSGYRKEDVITYLKCGLTGVSHAEADRFELYVEKWGIDSRRFTDGIVWNMSPGGYDRKSEGDGELLAELDRTRVKIIEPIAEFGELVREASTVREHADALLRFLSGLEIEERMAKRALELRGLGDTEGAETCGRAWQLLCDALDTVVDLLGDVSADALSFHNQLTSALSGEAVGHIPSLTDAVTVGSADMIRLGGKKHVYLIGVNTGEFPAGVNDTSYFVESEKALLKELGLPIEPDLEIKGARELYSFSRAFAEGRRSVTLIYCAKTPMLSPLLPSDVIERINDITRGNVQPIRISALDPLDTIYSEVRALEAMPRLDDELRSEVRSALIISGYGDKLAQSEGDIRNNAMTVDHDSLALIYKNDLYLSQTRIDKFLGCPMSYFCKYNLRLGENDPAELGTNVIGSFVHAVIENFFRTLEASGMSVTAIDDLDRERITRTAAEKYAEELLGNGAGGARTKAVISRLTRATKPVVDGLCEELSACKYKPTFFELETNSRDPDAPDHLVINRDGGGRIIVRGTIDRVDTYKSGDDVFVRIIDYKTGRTDFQPSKLADGEYLQMFLYLKAIADTKSKGFLEKLGVGEGGRVIPAGVIYVKTKVKDTTVRNSDDTEAESAVKSLQERDGMLLDNPESLEAMNPDFIPPETKRKESLRYDEAGWADIERTLTEVTTSVADAMTSGNIKATPATKDGRNCKWCRYKEICRSAVIKNDF